MTNSGLLDAQTLRKRQSEFETLCSFEKKVTPNEIYLRNPKRPFERLGSIFDSSSVLKIRVASSNSISANFIENNG